MQSIRILFFKRANDCMKQVSLYTPYKCLLHLHTWILETYTCLQSDTIQFKQLTLCVAITSSLPPTSHTYFTTSRCPPSQADMRQV